MEALEKARKKPPSDRWTSFEDWHWDGMDTRLEEFFKSLNKLAIVEHVFAITGQQTKISEPFSAGQYWCCLELISPAESLYVARIRLPTHPSASKDLDEPHRIDCEVATMKLVRERTNIPVPRVFSYEKEGSEWATRVGAAFMILEGFYGNTLQDVNWDFFALSEDSQKKVIYQWARFQVELATITFPQCGAIVQDHPPTVGEIATDEAATIGPFDDSVEYLIAIAEGKCKLASESSLPDDPSGARFHRLGPYIHADIIRKSNVFQSHRKGPFPLNHMDMGAQNLLVDDDFNIIAVIDWEMAQTSPWQAYYFPMPFPPLPGRDNSTILNDPDHIRHKHTVKAVRAQQHYLKALRAAEEDFHQKGKPLLVSLAEVFDSDASKVYWMMERHGADGAESDAAHMLSIAKIALGLETKEAEDYFQQLDIEMGRT